jgi:hypothetical protein
MIGDRGEQWLTGVALAVTLIATLLFLWESLNSGLHLSGDGPWGRIRLGLFVTVVLALIYGNVI